MTDHRGILSSHFYRMLITVQPHVKRRESRLGNFASTRQSEKFTDRDNTREGLFSVYLG